MLFHPFLPKKVIEGKLSDHIEEKRVVLMFTDTCKYGFDKFLKSGLV